MRTNTLGKKIIAAITIALFPQIECGAEIYQWTDDSGAMHFSEKKPENIIAEEISEALRDKINIIEADKKLNIESYKVPDRKKIEKVIVKIELVDYQLSTELRKIIRSKVKLIYRAYVQWFGWDRKPSRPIKIKIFGRYADFEAYQQGQRGGHVTNRSHYSPSRNEVVMLGTEFSDTTLKVLFHECSHAIFHMQMASGVKWINEGLAEVFESVKPNGKGVKVGFDKAWAEIIKHQLREGSLRTFREYMNIPSSEWRTESARVERSYYIIAWSMMRFLVATEPGAEALAKVITTSKDRPLSKTGKLAENFDGYYPGGIGKLDADWKRWIGQLRI